MALADSLVEWSRVVPVLATDRAKWGPVDPFTAVVSIVVLVLLAIIGVMVFITLRRGIDMVKKYGWAPMQLASRHPVTGWVTDHSAFLNGKRIGATTGTWRRWTAERFRWFENGLADIGTQTWFDCVRLPGALPFVAIRPIGGRRRGRSSSIVDRDALFEEFRKRWYIRDQGGWADLIVTEPLVRVLMADDAPRVPVTIAGDALFTHQKKWRRADTGLEERFNFLVRIAETIPRRTYDEMSANPAAAAAALAATHPFPGERPLVVELTKRNVLGTTSVVLAATFLLSPVGIVFGVLGWRAAQRGLASNRGIAVTGIVLNVVSTALLALLISSSITG